MWSKKLMNYVILTIAVLAIFSAGCTENPEEAMLLNEKADSLVQEGKYYEALENYNKASKLDPDNTDILLSKANDLYMIGLKSSDTEMYDNSIEVCDKIIKLESKNEDNVNRLAAFNLKISCLVDLDRYDEAIELLDQAIEEDSENAYSYFYTEFLIYRKMGNYEKAQECSDKAHQLSGYGY